MQALIVVDIQNDFIPDGALGVPGGEEIVPIVNRLMKRFPLVIATQDWHPSDHMSFAANHEGKQPGDSAEVGGVPQVLWPTHCVQESRGAQFTPALDRHEIDHIVQKGTRADVDSYSGFFDNGRLHQTNLHTLLSERGAAELFLCGLATDYCVKFTALDAVDLGYKTTLIVDACRGVNLSPQDVEQALDEMAQAGIQMVESKSLLNE